MESILRRTIQSVQTYDISYCKFLSANDTKSTGAHQSGYLVSKSAWQMFLNQEPKKGQNIKVNIRIKWQDDFETHSTFTYYGSAKNEFRLTNFGRHFPFREEKNTGDLFVLCKVNEDYFKAYILSHDEEIDDFLAAVNISSNQTNAIIPSQFQQTDEEKLSGCFYLFLKSIESGFPTTIELAKNARNCYNISYQITKEVIKSNPDKEIVNWLDAEYQLFKVIENDRYSLKIKTPFASVEEFIKTANTLLQRRKSRAGTSLEHHLAEVFRTFDLTFSTQSVTEANKKPDFLFPGIEAYLSSSFDHTKLFMLASKTTCKDRWRQVLNEADRIKVKHLFTLQQGISKNQLEEMYRSNVCLVVPAQYLKSFPKEFRNNILTLDSFIREVEATQKF